MLVCSSLWLHWMTWYHETAVSALIGQELPGDVIWCQWFRSGDSHQNIGEDKACSTCARCEILLMTPQLHSPVHSDTLGGSDGHNWFITVVDVVVRIILLLSAPLQVVVRIRGFEIKTSKPLRSLTPTTTNWPSKFTSVHSNTLCSGELLVFKC